MVIIDDGLCIGCAQCTIICPVQAIELIDDKAFVHQDLCVECSVCLRSRVCEKSAIKTQRLNWPREIRIPFSNVTTSHKLTGIAGRGTEEMKTNDVTNRFGPNEIGFSIEIGRPGLGCYLGVAEFFTVELAKIGVEFEKNSPVTSLLIDNEGHIQEEIKNERVLSAIIEFKVFSQEKAIQVLQIIRNMEKKVDTVYSAGVISRFSDTGSLPIIDFLSNNGFIIRPNAKINMGLGKQLKV